MALGAIDGIGTGPVTGGVALAEPPRGPYHLTMRLSTKLWGDYYLGGLLHALIKPAVIVLGKVLRRNHNLKGVSEIAILKLLGGGSLVIAYPMLLALRNSGRFKKMTAVTTPKTRAFAESLQLFDEIITIRDTSFFALLFDSFRAIFRLFRCPAIVDFEIHSRLSTVFCVLTLARNRIGFYTANSFWRRGLATHLLFCNLSGGIYHFYDQVAGLFEIPVVPFDVACEQFQRAFPPAAAKPVGGAGEIGARRIAIAPCCSDLGRERMLSLEQWRTVVGRVAASGQAYSLHLLGGPGDVAYTAALAEALSTISPPPAAVENLAGKLSLEESVAFLRTVERLFTIDSALLHFARLLRVPTDSFWGPTDPADRLRESGRLEERIHYARLTCSPCVHIASVPPCKGRNICMECAVNPDSPLPRNPIWPAESIPASQDVAQHG
jgi:ADP-heptose:LPS heptosyltransferase